MEPYLQKFENDLIIFLIHIIFLKIWFLIKYSGIMYSIDWLGSDWSIIIYKQRADLLIEFYDFFIIFNIHLYHDYISKYYSYFKLGKVMNTNLQYFCKIERDITISIDSLALYVICLCFFVLIIMITMVTRWLHIFHTVTGIW